jgi:DNA repair protein RecO (recombination protein O)
METIKTKGIVIGVASVSDNDKMLTMLTPDLGKISVFCKGAKKNRSAFLSSSEYLAFSDIVVFKGNSDIYSLNSAEPIEVFYNLRIDIEKLSYAAVMTKIIYDVSQEEERCDKKLQLLLNALYMLSETNKNPDLILGIFELRLLVILGFRPNLSHCVGCQKDIEDCRGGNLPLKNNEDECRGDYQSPVKQYYFSIKDNGIKCSTCAKQDYGAIKINITTYVALGYITTAESKKLFSFEIPEESINELILLSKIYISEKLEKEYKVIKY